MNVSSVLSSLFFLFVFGFATHAHSQLIKKSQVDDRTYAYETLDNGLKVLLISDPSTDKAAASLDVSVGSADNPKERLGLAHFLEHMLFLGTTQFPEPGEYQQFISQHGGRHNAYTSSENTNYFFDVSHESLAQALDRFSQFFISPLFNEPYVDRERRAVHSEYQAKIRDEYRQGADVYKQLLNSEHPYSQFHVGSLDTLSNTPERPIRKDLLEFYKTHYVASNMALVVIGKEPIEQLKTMVKQRFSEIPKGTSTPRYDAMPLFTENMLPKTVYIKPVRDTRNLTLVFPLSSAREYVLEKPLSYIGHIIGYEGEGSILSVLKKEGLAEGLSAGGDSSALSHSSFTISVRLTKKGYESHERVRALIFHALSILDKKGLSAERYNEVAQISALSFNFKEKLDPISTVSRLANNLQTYPPEDVIRGDYAFDRFDKHVIQRFLKQMTPSNALTMLTAPEAETDKTTFYYKVPYRVTDSKKLIANDPLFEYFHLPNANPFVAERLNLISSKKTSPQPVLTVNTDQRSLWFGASTKFGVPKAYVSARNTSPLIASSSKNAALAQLWVSMVNDQLNETLYDASIAGLQASLSASNRSIDVSLSGFNDKLPLLLEYITEQLNPRFLEEKRFERIKKELRRQWRNSARATPYKRLFSELPALVYSPYSTDQTLASELDKISFSDVQQFAKRWRKGVKQEALVYGNINNTAASTIDDALSHMVVKGAERIQPARVAKLKGASAIVHPIKVDHTDKAVALYVQAVDDSIADKAHVHMLQQIFEAPFYSDLRTEQQLGYIVFATSYSFKDVPSLVLAVQSPNTEVKGIKAAIETFIDGFFVPKDISQYQRAVLAQLEEKPKRLSELVQRYWQSIIREDNDFNHRDKLIDAVKKVTYDSLQSYYKAALGSEGQYIWLLSTTDKSTLPSAQSVQVNNYYEYP